MTKLIKNENLTLDSREVAQMVDKRHSDLLRDIEVYISYLCQNAILRYEDFFTESNYKAGTGKEYKNYQVTKKGCEFIAHKLTGSKGALFTATYINRFHEMEQTLKDQQKPQCIEDILITQLQEMKNIKLQVEETRQAIVENKQEVQAIRDVITINPKEEWRKETNKWISKICYKLQDYKTPKDEIYRSLEERAKCKLSVRLKNLQGRAALNGMAQNQVDKLNNLDVIANDIRLKEIYINIVRQMAIKHGVRA